MKVVSDIFCLIRFFFTQYYARGLFCTAVHRAVRLPVDKILPHFVSFCYYEFMYATKVLIYVSHVSMFPLKYSNRPQTYLGLSFSSLYRVKNNKGLIF